MVKKYYKHFLFFLCLLAGGGFVVWKCKYGFANVDESFYITIPYRLYKGDSLFKEEWHLSQMSGFLTYPLVCFYLRIKGGLDGITLFMRYACSFFQILTAAFIYIRLNKISWGGALVASISYLLYIPFGIMALSYNSLGIMMLLIFSVIISTAEKKLNLQYLIAGVFYAAAVLCCPLLLFVFLAYCIFVAVVWLGNRSKRHLFEKTSQNYFFSPKGALFISLGSGFLAILFFAFVFSKISFSQLIEALPFIFDDPEHGEITIKYAIAGFFYFVFQKSTLGYVAYPIYALLFLFCFFDKKRKERKNFYILIGSLISIICLLDYFFINKYINFIMWPVNLLSLLIAFLDDNPEIRKMFSFNWIVGIAYAFCLNATSNQRFYAISSASSVSAVGSIIIISIYVSSVLREEKNMSSRKNKVNRLASCSICSLIFLQLIFQLILRYDSVYSDKLMSSQTVKLNFGHQAGILVTEEKYELYCSVTEDMKILDDYQGKKVLFLSENTWYYLMGDYEFATFSAWFTSEASEKTVERLGKYYELNPLKLPDVVYSDAEYKNEAFLFSRLYGYNVVSENERYILLSK